MLILFGPCQVGKSTLVAELQAKATLRTCRITAEDLAVREALASGSRQRFPLKPVNFLSLVE